MYREQYCRVSPAGRGFQSLESAARGAASTETRAIRKLAPPHAPVDSGCAEQPPPLRSRFPDLLNADKERLNNSFDLPDDALADVPGPFRNPCSTPSDPQE